MALDFAEDCRLVAGAVEPRMIDVVERNLEFLDQGSQCLVIADHRHDFR